MLVVEEGECKLSLEMRLEVLVVVELVVDIVNLQVYVVMLALLQEQLTLEVEVVEDLLTVVQELLF
tara:strand:+ start:556 stop:753 length:198 start_codon:yes stop_codon:yes gene_type:complete